MASVLAKKFEQNFAKIYINPIMFVYIFFLIQSIQAQTKGTQKLFIQENSEYCQAQPKQKTTSIKPTPKTPKLRLFRSTSTERKRN